MWGGIPFMMTSVVKIRRKSWGAKSRGLPAASVSPARVIALLRRVRMPAMGMGRLSRPMVRWNSRGMGGFQTFS